MFRGAIRFDLTETGTEVEERNSRRGWVTPSTAGVVVYFRGYLFLNKYLSSQLSAVLSSNTSSLNGGTYWLK